MDGKNDESSISSDSLDKTLQTKCQMHDVGQGDGVHHTTTIKTPLIETTTTSATTTSATITEKSGDDFDLGTGPQPQQQTQKTEILSTCDGINAAATEARVSSLHFFKPSSTISGTFSRVLDSDDDSDIDDDTYHSNLNKLSADSIGQKSSETTKLIDTTSSIPQKTLNIFETKVTQISENLKETKLEIAPQLNASTSSSSQSKLLSTESESILPSTSASTTTATSSLIEELPGPSTSSKVAHSENNSKTTLEHDSTSTSLKHSDSVDDPMDQRAKKVRFHPDAKENDGGKRVVPKKKKKIKSSAAQAIPTPAPPPQCEELEEPEEIEINLDEIAAMAEKYLEEHPLTFVPSWPEFRHLPPFTNPLPFGLMVEDDDDDKELDETAEEVKEIAETLKIADETPEISEEMKIEGEMETFKLLDQAEKLAQGVKEKATGVVTVEKVEEHLDEEMKDIKIEVENGVECILAKRTIEGKESYLLRFVQKADLLWEPAEFIHKTCPNLLIKYEDNLENQELHLMDYLTERQNYRQRYTDF